MFFFFFKQKTAYEKRSSDWSSDVCSSDLLDRQRDLIADRRHVAGHPPIGTLQRRTQIGAACRAPADRMVLADEMRDGQRDGPGHAVHGKCAGNGRELIAIERDVIALE